MFAPTKPRTPPSHEEVKKLILEQEEQEVGFVEEKITFEARDFNVVELPESTGGGYGGYGGYGTPEEPTEPTEPVRKLGTGLSEMNDGTKIANERHNLECGVRIPNFVLRSESLIRTWNPGLKWDVPMNVMGLQEIENEELASELESMESKGYRLTQEILDRYKSKGLKLNYNSFIKVGVSDGSGGVSARNRALAPVRLAEQVFTSQFQVLELPPVKVEETSMFGMEEHTKVGDSGFSLVKGESNSYFKAEKWWLPSSWSKKEALDEETHVKFATPHFVGPSPPPAFESRDSWSEHFNCDPRVGNFPPTIQFNPSYLPIRPVTLQNETTKRFNHLSKVEKLINDYLKSLTTLEPVPTRDLSGMKFLGTGVPRVDKKEIGDLSGFRFSSLKLFQAKFEDCHLCGALFEHCDLTGVTFARCDMYGVEFRECILTGVTMKSCCLDKMTIKHRYYNNAENQSETHGAEKQSNTYPAACFAESNTVGQIVLGRHERMYVTDSTMHRAEVFANLTGAEFDNVHAAGVEFHGSLYSCVFLFSNLKGAKFNSSYLDYPYFGETLLTNASFDTAFLNEARFTVDPKRRGRRFPSEVEHNLWRTIMAPPLPLAPDLSLDKIKKMITAPSFPSNVLGKDSEQITQMSKNYGLCFLSGWWSGGFKEKQNIKPEGLAFVKEQTELPIPRRGREIPEFNELFKAKFLGNSWTDLRFSKEEFEEFSKGKDLCVDDYLWIRDLTANDDQDGEDWKFSGNFFGGGMPTMSGMGMSNQDELDRNSRNRKNGEYAVLKYSFDGADEVEEKWLKHVQTIKEPYQEAWELFDRIRFSGASFRMVQAPSDHSGHHFQGCNLQGVNFGEAVLVGSRFEDADLTGCVFTNADLQSVSMGGAIIKRCDFRSAKNLDPRQPWTIGDSRISGKTASYETYKLPKRSDKSLSAKSIAAKHAASVLKNVSGALFAGSNSDSDGSDDDASDDDDDEDEDQGFLAQKLDEAIGSGLDKLLDTAQASFQLVEGFIEEATDLFRKLEANIETFQENEKVKNLWKTIANAQDERKMKPSSTSAKKALQKVVWDLEELLANHLHTLTQQFLKELRDTMTTILSGLADKDQKNPAVEIIKEELKRLVDYFIKTDVLETKKHTKVIAKAVVGGALAKMEEDFTLPAQDILKDMVLMIGDADALIFWCNFCHVLILRHDISSLYVWMWETKSQETHLFKQGIRKQALQMLSKQANSELDSLVSWKFGCDSKKLRCEKVGLVSQMAKKLEDKIEKGPVGGTQAHVNGSDLGNRIVPTEEKEGGVSSEAQLGALQNFPIKQLKGEVIGSVLRTPTKYQKPKGWSFLPTSIGRILLRPATDLIKDLNQTQYLLNEIKELQKGGFTNETWRDSVSTWIAFLNLYKQMNVECGLYILESIAADKNVMDAIGAVAPLIEINGYLPSDLLILLNKGPANHIRDHAYQYMKRLQTEEASIRRLQEYQARLFALLGTAIIAAFVSVGNVVARFAYDVFKADAGAIWVWVVAAVGSVIVCAGCCALTIYLMRSANRNSDEREYERVENV